jgi:hypothetical protein
MPTPVVASQLLLLNDFASFVQYAVPTGAIAKVQADGSRQYLGRDGSCSFAFTARNRRSSTKHGVRARSSWLSDREWLKPQPVPIGSAGLSRQQPDGFGSLITRPASARLGPPRFSR